LEVEMSYEVQTVREPGRHVAVTRFEASPVEMAGKVGPAFATVIARLGTLGIAPAGPAVCVYETAGAQFRVAAGFVVDRPVGSDGTVVPLQLPATEVATTTHTGAYEDLGKAYDALASQSRERGREVDRAAPMWEEYWSTPGVPPEQTRTVVSWPLRPVA
jgi:effector-binding domain-containing protein